MVIALHQCDLATGYSICSLSVSIIAPTHASSSAFTVFRYVFYGSALNGNYLQFFSITFLSGRFISVTKIEV